MNRGGEGRGADREQLSQHPTDRLIRDLIAKRQQPSEAEAERIIQRLSSVEFDARAARVPQELQALIRASLGATTDRLTIHLLQRVLINKQWRGRTTASEFLADLRAIARHRDARIAMYEARGGNIVLAVVETRLVIQPERLGSDPERFLVVVYSADRGVIVTGYQASAFDTIRVGEGALWLH